MCIFLKIFCARCKEMGFFDSIGGFFSDAGHWIKGAAESVWDTASGVVTTVYDDAKGVVSGVKDTQDNIVKTVGHSVDNVVDKGSEVVQKGEDVIGDTVEGVTGFLSSPGFLLVAAGGLYILMSRSGQ